MSDFLSGYNSLADTAMKKLIVFCLMLISVGAMAHDYVPGEKQQTPILLKGGDLYTVTDGVLKNTDLLFENGRITQIGSDITPPVNTEIIDVTGKRIYPGLIAPHSNIGLIEIGGKIYTIF